MSSTLQATVRAQLEEERDQLRRQLGDLGEGGEGPSFDENFADSSQVAAEQGEVRAITTNLRALLTEVEHALAKLDDGTYGACEACGQPISEPRLEAMPATRFCVEHA
jgi:DnaK suppressor protein